MDFKRFFVLEIKSFDKHLCHSSTRITNQQGDCDKIEYNEIYKNLTGIFEYTPSQKIKIYMSLYV